MKLIDFSNREKSTVFPKTFYQKKKTRYNLQLKMSL